ncbi:MAG: hypothetical protein ACTSYS_06890 [Promethearchaeota archaeon]
MKKITWKIIHWFIIINFLLEIGYGAFQIFFVLNNGSFGPLFGSAQEITFELMVTRRLYAIETWIATTGLAIYIALIYKNKIRAALENKKDRQGSVV